MTNIVLVCGGREYRDADAVNAVLDRLDQENGITMVVHGGALGADRLAHNWAADHGIYAHAYHADWRTHGRAAGPIRNQEMLDKSKPDLVVSFPGGRGTADMVRRARKAGVPVMEVGDA